ncbi:sulfatase-like hydrolase/transferase [Singulisphaera sp. PoT]|uniref:sulfatase-like hydrolase/transferase n=1 Tax=Singulisphaera sp. PoT TaxID=3411797 RepID=UPI003BF5B196
MSTGLDPDEQAGGPDATASAGARGAPVLASPFRTALWFGLVAGFVELLPVHLKTWLLQAGIYRKNPNLVWMIPASLGIIFAAFGLLLVVLKKYTARLAGRPAVFSLCALAVLSVLLAVPGLQAFASLILAIGVASWIAPAIVARADGFDRLVRRSLPLLSVVLLAIVGVSLGKGPFREWIANRGLPAPPKGAPNVLLVVMDTVRADDTSLHGYARDTTPNLAALAGRGLMFERAIATAPWTLPSHASMFTGRWSWEVSVGFDRALDARYPTLAESLARRGYATGGFIANTVFCSAEYGLSRGFAHYEDYLTTPIGVLRSSALGWLISMRVGSVIDRIDVALHRDPRHPLEEEDDRKPAALINREALGWIDRQAGRPFFAFINYIDAHDPYLLPPGEHKHFGRRPKTLADFQLLRDWEEHDKRTCSPEDLVMARDAYDDCIAALDVQLGALMKSLESRKLLENTVVIITSDHGEHFGEHSREGRPIYGHRASVYQPEIHVPLLIIAPGKVQAGEKIPGAVSLRDLPATVLDLVGLDNEAKFPGNSLVNPLRNWSTSPDKASHDQEPVLSEFSSRQDIAPDRRYATPTPGLSRALISGDKAYLRLDGRDEALYNLADDPVEAHDLSKQPDAAPSLQGLRSTLDRLIPTPQGK